MTIELKGVEKLNKVFEQFFADLGYDEIECKISTEFAYYHANNLITYSLLEMPLLDIGFRNYLKKTYPCMPECSMMVFSLLHELGHHLTMDNINKKKWLKCKKAKKIVEKRKCYTNHDVIQKQFDYCKLFDEAQATKKAVYILIENYDYIIDFEEIWYNAVMNFYAENNITND